MKNILCCKNCQNRHYACHEDCEEYVQEKAELEKYNRNIAEQKAKIQNANSFAIEGRLKCKRKK